MAVTLPPPPPPQPTDRVFPFGQPNTPRPARWDGQGTPRQLVLGVYPSALHVRWHPPAHLRASPTRIAAMAVDVEPEVFWDGGHATSRIAAWKERVGFLDGDAPGYHGHASPTTNGPSGSTLDGYFTGPIHDRGDTVFADVYPVYMVKRSSPETKRQQQGDALDKKFNPLADRLPATAVGPAGPSTLPTRIPPRALPASAVARFGGWLQELLRTLNPDTVITLGQEPWSALDLLPGVELRHHSPDLAATRTQGYGQPGTLHLDGRDVAWIPLAHPGLLQSPSADGRNPSWQHVHAAWAARS